MKVDLIVESPTTDASAPGKKSGKLCGRKVQCCDLSIGWACSIALTIAAVVVSVTYLFKSQ